jgi:hypothetical protein
MEITTSSYSNPSLENQSYTILQMVIAAIKKTLVEFNTISNLPEHDEKTMIDLGVKILKNSATAEDYSSKLIKIIERLIHKKIGSDKDYLERKIQGYVRRDLVENTNTQVLNLTERLEKLTNKKIILL